MSFYLSDELNEVLREILLNCNYLQASDVVQVKIGQSVSRLAYLFYLASELQAPDWVIRREDKRELNSIAIYERLINFCIYQIRRVHP